MIPLPGPRLRHRRRPGVISVPLPSRHRPEMLARSIASLRETAVHPELLEVLIAHDPDDPQTAQTARALDADVVWEAPTRYGYAGQAHYYTALLGQVTGEWVLPTWGDDGLMQTPGWDEIVRAQPRCSVLFVDGNYPGLTCFPIVHMDVFCVLGRLCPLPATDTWYELAAQAAGILIHPDPPIFVQQDRFDLTGNNNDETYREGRAGYRLTEFYSSPYTGWRADDAVALRQHMDFSADYEARLAGAWSDIQAHLPAMRDFVLRYPGAVVGELGTRTGESTSAFLAGASLVGGHVWSIDCGGVTVPPQWWASPSWSFRQADDMSDEAAGFMPAELDVLFIDTSHYYDHTVAELERYVPRVRHGGVVLMHDTELLRTRIAEYEGADPGGPDVPVEAALNDFCAAAGLTWTNIPGSFGLGVIEIP